MNEIHFSPMNSPLGLLCPLIGLALVVLIIVTIVRAVGRAASGGGGGIQPAPPNVVTQLGTDGFWIVSCPAEPGSLIHYHFWTGGVKHSGRVPYQPGADGRQFIYTGARPEQASVVSIMVPSDDIQPDPIPPILGAAAMMWGSSSNNQPDTSSAPSSPPSFPSAY